MLIKSMLKNKDSLTWPLIELPANQEPGLKIVANYLLMWSLTWNLFSDLGPLN